VVLGLVWGLLFGFMGWLSRANFILADAWAAYSRLPSVTPPLIAGIGQMPVWLRAAVVVPVLLLTSIIGLLVVVLVRPKNRAAEVVAGAATGLVGGMATFAFGGGWLFVVATTLFPASQEGSDLRLLSEAAYIEERGLLPLLPPGANRHPEPAERLLEKYPDLREVPAPERGRLLYQKIMADWTAGIPVGIGLGLLCIVGMSLVVTLAETLAAGMLLRRLGQVRAVIWPYIELAVPGAILAIGLFAGLGRLFAGWFTGHSGQLLILLLALALLVLAITAVLRGWHWLVRSLLHLGWMASVSAWVMMEQARFRELGG
jgi:hypothetical protein